MPGTLGTAQFARSTAAASTMLGKAAKVATIAETTFDVATGAYDVGKGITQIASGDKLGYLTMAGGAMRTAGGFAGARELAKVSGNAAEAAGDVSKAARRA